MLGNKSQLMNASLQESIWKSDLLLIYLFVFYIQICLKQDITI